MEDMHAAFVLHHFPASVARHAELSRLLSAPNVRVADIGCCAGQLLRSLAHRNSTGHFVGFEIESAFVEYGRNVLLRPENATIASRVSFQIVSSDAEPKRDTRPQNVQQQLFDVVLSSDMLHDATQPLAILRAAHSLLAPGGLYLVVEPTVAASTAKQLQNDPAAAFKFGTSLHGCLPSGMCERDGAALGTLGLTDVLLQRLAREAGFHAVQRIDATPDPFNSYWILRCGETAKL